MPAAYTIFRYYGTSRDVVIPQHRTWRRPGRAGPGRAIPLYSLCKQRTHRQHIAAFVYAGLYQQFGTRNSGTVRVGDSEWSISQVRDGADGVWSSRSTSADDSTMCSVDTLCPSSGLVVVMSSSSSHRFDASFTASASLRQLTARLQISACRMVVHNGVFCGTEAGAATTEKGALSGIKVLDLTRSENESVRYIIQM